MKRQLGFTLIELMIVIAIIAILSAIGIPAYQGYLQKAALTDMLQTGLPYKTAVELCAIERGTVSGCSEGTNGVPVGSGSRFVASVSVQNGTLTLAGQESLSSLNVTLQSQWDSAQGQLAWQRQCISEQASLKSACESVFRFDDMQ